MLIFKCVSKRDGMLLMLFGRVRKQYVAFCGMQFHFIIEKDTESKIFYDSCDNRLDLKLRQQTIMNP